MSGVPPLAERSKPGLSKTLTEAPHPAWCQSCGSDQGLQTWNECDAWDQPQRPPVLVVLCSKCSGRLIEPSPRLYRQVDRLAPVPGSMVLCVSCRHRAGLRCTHPSLRANGGPGLEVQFPKPTMMHVNYGGGRGEFRNVYPGPPTACAGRETVLASCP